MVDNDIYEQIETALKEVRDAQVLENIADDQLIHAKKEVHKKCRVLYDLLEDLEVDIAETEYDKLAFHRLKLITDKHQDETPGTLLNSMLNKYEQEMKSWPTAVRPATYEDLKGIM